MEYAHTSSAGSLCTVSSANVLIVVDSCPCRGLGCISFIPVVLDGNCIGTLAISS